MVMLVFLHLMVHGFMYIFGKILQNSFKMQVNFINVYLLNLLSIATKTYLIHTAVCKIFFGLFYTNLTRLGTSIQYVECIKIYLFIIDIYLTFFFLLRFSILFVLNLAANLKSPKGFSKSSICHSFIYSDTHPHTQTYTPKEEWTNGQNDIHSLVFFGWKKCHLLLEIGIWFHYLL